MFHRNDQKGLALSGSKGFTLIELLVVIVVISILVALTLPNLFSAQQRGRDTQRKNDVKNIQQQLETYYTDNNYYPTTVDTLVTDGYLDAKPQDPQGGDYVYAPTADGTATCDNTTTNCGQYTLTADLENTNDPDADGSGNYVADSINQ